MYEVIYQERHDRIIKLACVSLNNARLKLAQTKAYLYQRNMDVVLPPRIVYTGDDLYEASLC
jgi:hypothetical protein